MGKRAVLQSSRAAGPRNIYSLIILLPHPQNVHFFHRRGVKNKAKSLLLPQKSMARPHLACGVPPTQKEYDRTKRFNTERKMHKYIEWLLYEEPHKLGFVGVFWLRKEDNSSIQNDYCNVRGEWERSVIAQNKSSREYQMKLFGGKRK